MIRRKLIGILLVSSIVFLLTLLYTIQPTVEDLNHNYETCKSRYESGRYRKESIHKPSSYLISRLSEYEELHKRCGPHTEAYKRKVRKLESGGHLIDEKVDDNFSDCKYLVRIPLDGLGNRMLSLASAFLYAILTNRVLLVHDKRIRMYDLFCEPFPETTWLLPRKFPIWKRLDTLNQESPESFGKKLSGDFSLLPFLYLHIAGGYNENDQRFFCDQCQIDIQNVSWLIMKSNFYFIPSLFLIPSFEQELDKLFPKKDTVFQFLGRYLFLPSNPVWELITDFYQTHLANSDEKIGIQIRLFDREYVASLFKTRWEYNAIPKTIVSCALENQLLPQINPNKSLNPLTTTNKSISVIVTSLTSDYFEKIKKIYSKKSTLDGSVVQVFQPSSVKIQKTGSKWHNMKAWADMYLLSLSDKLITSPGSTFGYVAQGLGGLTPWSLHMPDNETVRNPPCSRAMSSEPCFHVPPSKGCDKRSEIDTGSIVSHVRHCEDFSWGIKLVDPNHH